MTPFRHILVPTDFSDTAASALDLALPFAKAFDAPVTLFHASWMPPTADASFVEGVAWPTDAYAQKAQQRLDELCAATRARFPRVDAHVVKGEPVDEILRIIGNRGIDLVVLGTHGRRGLSHLLIGSVAERIVRLSPIPVVTTAMRSAATPPALRRILVPTDFGEAADEALDAALALAPRFDARVSLLHVFAMPVMAYAADIAPPIDEMMSAAQRELDRVLARARAGGVAVDGELVSAYSPPEAIVDHARRHGSDLVVMGTHGRRGLSRALLGSVAERVVRTSPAPVLTFRPKTA